MKIPNPQFGVGVPGSNSEMALQGVRSYRCDRSDQRSSTQSDSFIMNYTCTGSVLLWIIIVLDSIMVVPFSSKTIAAPYYYVEYTTMYPFPLFLPPISSEVQT
jgi:hypothetical protein